jgi:hypothetical protein
MLLNEGLSDILYHFTNPYNLISILKENNFHSSINIGSTADFKTSGGKFYFFSTTRSKIKRYINRNVKIVLDGRKLGTKYKGLPIDYWGYSKDPKDWPDKSSYRTALLSSEEEDRIVLDKPYIDNAKSYIKEIHILIDKHTDLNTVEEIEKNKENINIFYYTDENSYLTERKNKSVDPFSLGLDKNNKEPYTSPERIPYSLWRIIAVMSYKDEEMKDKIVNILSDGNDIEEIKNKIDELIKKDKYDYYNSFKYEDDSYKVDFLRLISSDIHNLRTSTDKRVYKIFMLLTNYMKKNQLKNINEYLHNKLKGSFKYLNDYRKDVYKEITDIIDNRYNEYINQYNSYRYNIGDYTYNNVFDEFPELKDFIKRILNNIKLYFYKTIFNKENEFKYLSGYTNKDYVRQSININSLDTKNILNEPISEDLEDDLIRIIENIISDVNYDTYNIIQKYIEKHREQFNIKENKIIKEFIDLSNHYEHKTLQENNKIGFYQFTTDKGIIYNVNLGIYTNNIKGNRFTSLNIDFTANGSWEVKPNNKDIYKTLNTIAKIIGNFYNKNKYNIDYISYVIQDLNKNKKHSLYQYILNKLNIKIIDSFKQGSDIYSKIEKQMNESKLINIIHEEYGKILGKGTSGTAYLTDDGKVNKQTNSIYEFIMAKKIMKYEGKLNTLPKIHETGKNNDGGYFIIKDYYKNIPEDFKSLLKNKENQKFIDNYFKNNENKDIINEIFGSKFISFLDNLKLELPIISLNPKDFDVENMGNNIGVDENNNYILFDF